MKPSWLALIRQSIRSMIEVSDKELDGFLEESEVQVFPKKSIIHPSGIVPHYIYFINSGLIRLLVVDREGTEHSTHFAMENQFIADYSCFMRQEPSLYTLQALEKTEVVLLPRKAIEWGYTHMTQGDKLGRLIAEFYFIFQDNRIKNQYSRSPKERYDSITQVYPNIHNRVPQHMIASHLGISPVHLSRLKKDHSQKT